MTAEDEEGLCHLFDGNQPQILQTGRWHLGERLVDELPKCVPPPQSESLLERLGRAKRIASTSHGLTFCHQPFESVRVDGVGFYGEHVAGPPREDDVTTECSS